jgi:hypothetical protein
MASPLERSHEPRTDAETVSPETPPPTAPDPAELRLACLQPHVGSVLGWAADVDPEDVPHFVAFGAFQIELGSWERQLLKAWDAHDRECSLLAEGIAYDLRVQELADIFEHGPMPEPAELAAFLERLIGMAAVGRALAHEMQWSVNRLIGDGRLPEAKSQTCFRTKIVKALDQIEDRVGAAGLEQAERRSEPMLSVCIVPEPSLTEPAIREEQPETHTWANYGPALDKGEVPLPAWLTIGGKGSVPEEPTVAPAHRKSRVAPLVITLGVLIGIYVAVVAPRVAQPSGPTVLTAAQFTHVEGVAAIVARPPSLYVTVHFEAWEKLTSEQRTQWLETVGQVAARAGYFGMRARTPDGRTVGQWLQKTGVTLIQPHKDLQQEGAGT